MKKLPSSIFACTLLLLSAAPVYAHETTTTPDVPSPTPAPRTTSTPSKPAGTRRGAGNAGDRVRRLRSQHPEWTVSRIAERAGVSERTARRHLNATSTNDASGPDADLAA